MPPVLMLAAALCTTVLGSLTPIRSHAEDVDRGTEDTESVFIADESSVSFSRDIRPLLSNRCFACHGPDADSREGGLRLDQPDGDEGAIGYAIEPHSVEDSEVWLRITADDESMLMPPPDSHLEPFNEEETELIRRWIESGAVYEDFWAFRAPERPQPPVTQHAEWSAQTVDQFVLRKLESQQRRPSEEADARTLLRRVTFDLTGLPPSREAIRQFESAYANSPELAWEELIDDLLSRPQFGEHIARHWLDLVRFADTNGMHKDFYRNHVAYRDWVIRSFNDDLPYDEFVRDQIAGDLYPQPTKDQLIASGFNRLHLIIDRGTALPEESHVKNVLDRVTAVGTAFMGLTVQCAQCHDHKFDPITQKDFFSLYAFFNNIDAQPETNPRKVVDGFQEPFARFPTDAQQAELDRLDAELAKLDQQIRSEEKQTNQPEEKLKSRLESLQKQRGQEQRDRDAVERSVEKAMVMKERDEVRKTFVLIRGQYDAPGEEVQRGVPGFLPPLKPQSETPSRMDLANWMVAPENPLTARVAVNRFWQLFFGVGLVKTSEDFGNQGEVPSHPELLDELAVSFVESGWDVKALLKRIVMSKTYRQSSRATPDEFKADAENRLLSRGPRYRLDAEMIRDQILFSSGLLSTRMHGPSVKPPQPDGLWKAVSMTGERFRPDQGESIYRRSIYTFWKRAMPPPQMTILNAPNRDACIARRERTNTPTQALLLLNESEYLRAARQLAQSTLAEPAEDRILFAYETVTAKLPDSKEVDVLQTLLNDLRDEYASSPKLVDDLCEGVSVDSPQDKVELAAWTVLCNTLYNLDITKTKD
ncbi:PSD1 and planctomycete cytochrome C domain-containing protein [Rhodopirellula bahusiensis]|uniref:Chromosome segregation protein n=1 Tax=Rhodopirellula bahusiensis TaxID=2014065 RepID=A0A2G1VZB8_9BACT|nr:PSD1 and planctomycete cytochrome C domain-containing protein [Rhodopirellula bahusiensis]PHQ32138.1 chromosome segregation protein [Rhodopirellula bahusiensis]